MGSTAVPDSSPHEPNRHLWWALSPVYTAGVVAFVPALHAAYTLRRPALWCWAAALVSADVFVWWWADGPPDSALHNAAAGLAMALAVVGSVLALRVRYEVFTRGRAESAPTGVGHHPAVARALADRQRRLESMQLAARDASLARDLGIGRPDLEREYDDGGLVDVNHVPTPVLTAHLDLTAEQAQRVVEAREHLGGFAGADDLGIFASLPPATLDRVRDRVIAL